MWGLFLVPVPVRLFSVAEVRAWREAREEEESFPLHFFMKSGQGFDLNRELEALTGGEPPCSNAAAGRAGTGREFDP